MTDSSFIQPQTLTAGQWQAGAGEVFTSWNPSTDCAITECREATTEDADRALTAAAEAHAILRSKTGKERAQFLRTIASEIENLGDELITTAMQETGLPEARLQGERGRTCGQIRAFADLVEEGSWVQAAIDTALPERTPLPKPDVRAMLTSLGPVAVFGASNFPFAFGCIGGDAASALAGGNPVVAKGHPSHPATSTLFAKAILNAITTCDFPVGTFSLLQGHSHDLGAYLASQPSTKAIGFTGSLQGGRALMDTAAQRPTPIPVYAEMGSINPVFILPDALAQKSTAIASGLSASIAQGTGQFCTNPGLIITLAGFAEPLAAALAEQPQGCLLNPSIAEGMHKELVKRQQLADLELLTGGTGDAASLRPNNTLMKTSASAFLSNPALQEEIFGPTSLLIECESMAQMQQVAEQLQGNLTATIHTEDYDNPNVKALLNQLTAIAGRVLFNGYPTGVEVCPAMQHGGPYPASSASATTSVGTAAITRFCQRVSYQDCPDNLLPAELQNANPLSIWRLLNGEQTQTTAGEA